MKVVLFCGGLGLRLRDYSDTIPKALVNIGDRPIIWHLMKYYAHYGHKDFILCLGHRARAIKEYFLHYDECVTNDFTLTGGGKDLQLLSSDIHDWRITFVDTGLHANIGQRLKAVEQHLAGEEVFLANYADGLTDLPLPRLIDFYDRHGKVACFLGVKPMQSFHVLSMGGDGQVTALRAVASSDVWVNGGFFVLRRDIFRYIEDGEELVEKPFQRLIEQQQLAAYRYDGFWACMDTFKEKQRFDDMHAKGEVPWEVWRSAGAVSDEVVHAGGSRVSVPAIARNGHGADR